MPTYHYRARDKFGALFSGTLETAGKEAAAAQLDSLGYYPVAIQEERPHRTRFDLSGLRDRLQPIRPEDMIVFTRQLATLIGAGIPFLATFDALSQQTTSPKLRGVIEKIRRDVESGSTLSDALARHPQVFSPMYISMVRAGEVGGVLEEILLRLALLAEHDADTRARIKSATRYPKIVISAMVVAFFILVTFVFPKFAAFYANFNAELPLPTRILIETNHIVQNYGLFVLAALIVAGVGIVKAIHTPSGRFWWDGMKLRLPVFGPIFSKSAFSRFARIFGVLTRSGLPVLEILEVSAQTVDNVVIARVIDGIGDSARQGRGLVQPMKVSGVFPPIVVQMVAVGEETGQMDEMMTKVSEYYDRDVEYAINNLSKSLEPLLLVVIGGVILFLYLAVLLPWWNLINVVKGGG